MKVGRFLVGLAGFYGANVVLGAPEDDLADAIRADNAAGVTTAIGAGANVNLNDLDGFGDNGGADSANSAIGSCQSVAVLSALMAAPALNLDLLSVSGLHALHYYSIFGYSSLITQLFSGSGTPTVDTVATASFPGTTPLHMACQPLSTGTNQAAVADALLTNGANVNAKVASSGRTPLMIAIANTNIGQSQQQALVAELLAAGSVDLSIVDSQTQTTLHYASDVRNAKSASLITQVLTKSSTEKNAVNANGDAPIHLIVGSTSRETETLGNQMLAALLATNPTISLQDAQGQTALHLACASGLSVVVDSLIAAGLTDNVVDSSSNTALHVIAGRPIDSEAECDISVAIANKLLSSGGSDQTLRNDLNQTARQVAESNIDQCVALMNALGSDRTDPPGTTDPPKGESPANTNTISSVLVAFLSMIMMMMVQ